MNNKAFFDVMAEKWDSICQHDTDKINRILDMVHFQEGSTVLDVGTGTGVLLPFLRSRIGKSGRITAIDISHNMLEIAKKKYSHLDVHFVEGDIMTADFQPEYFDHIVCYSVFPHFEDKQAAIQHLSQFLKKGGLLVICHSQSREAINHLHKEASEAVANDNLPDVATIRSFFYKARMDTAIEIDNEEMFVVIGQK